ncbi:MarR family winged helix-turn-helix transcriptional regulator [Bergeriella denitrificans]|uniref:Multiple antibiotic resistance protein marR n=1 Tax=Bergeriella denitrificans TaxID=494 RepID=A0A378UHH2_BERDE|nr:MarR family winged helix-turn-helix transcriptional regulator [Bergeriella denitrificans]STZ76590.1 Multiple antibiotic resistance protein marR [Bergeriella denitrificans]
MNDSFSDGGNPPAVSYNIGRLDRAVSRRLAEALKPVGVSLPQFTMLSHLERRGATANAALAARSFISPQAANQIVNTMMAHGWVAKRGAPNHGRMVLIDLTDEGREVYRRCMSAAEECEEKMLRGLTPESVMMFKATVQRLLDNLRGV